MDKEDILKHIGKKFNIESSQYEENELKAYFNDGKNRFFISIKNK